MSMSALLLQSACSTMPKDRAALETEISLAIGHPVTGAVISAGTWYQNAQGFAVLKSLTPASQVGIIVIARGRVSFLQWNDTQSRFSVVRAVSYIDAKQVFVDRLGVARMLVVQDATGTFDSFEFTRGFGMLRTTEQAERALNVVLAERG